jgi:hypothetical protein
LAERPESLSYNNFTTVVREGKGGRKKEQKRRAKI